MTPLTDLLRRVEGATDILAATMQWAREMSRQPQPENRDRELCRTCHGSGNILTFSRRLEWWNCPACGGAGARVMFGAA